eukprot:452244-Hanusia_phi.AAC.1
MEHIEELQGKTSSSASPAVKTEEVLGAFDNALEEWFGVGDGTKGVFRKKAKQGFCPGCGCKLQSTMQTAPGYVPESKVSRFAAAAAAAAAVAAAAASALFVTPPNHLHFYHCLLVQMSMLMLAGAQTGEEKTVCARCYSLQHYGKVDPDLTAQNAKYAEVRRRGRGETRAEGRREVDMGDRRRNSRGK